MVCLGGRARRNGFLFKFSCPQTVFLEHLNRSRHAPHFIAAIRPIDIGAEIATGEHVHGEGHPLDRTHQPGTDSKEADAENDDQAKDDSGKCLGNGAAGVRGQLLPRLRSTVNDFIRRSCKFRSERAESRLTLA